MSDEHQEAMAAERALPGSLWRRDIHGRWRVFYHQGTPDTRLGFARKGAIDLLMMKAISPRKAGHRSFFVPFPCSERRSLDTLENRVTAMEPAVRTGTRSDPHTQPPTRFLLRPRAPITDRVDTLPPTSRGRATFRARGPPRPIEQASLHNHPTGDPMTMETEHNEVRDDRPVPALRPTRHPALQVLSRRRTAAGPTVWSRCACGSTQVREVEGFRTRLLSRGRPVRSHQNPPCAG